MNIRLKELSLGCKKAKESIPFKRFNYFHGQMGAGKSTIARLVDYCLGGDLELTPALQSEFVYAALDLEVDGKPLFLKRELNAGNLLASFSDADGPVQVSIPARKAEGALLPNTKIEVLSDLIFYLAGKDPPMVRKSKTKEDSELARLSIRVAIVSNGQNGWVTDT